MTPLASRRFLGTALILLFVWVVVASVRWVRRDHLPGPASDLEVPRLFVPDDLTVADLEHTSPEGVPVLCYHYFGPGLTPERALRVLGAVLLSMPTLPDKDYWTIPVGEFERQMEWLHDEGYHTLGLDELADWMDGRALRPEKAVVITIDDGDESLIRYAAPVLRKFGFRATVFFLTGRAGERDWNDLDFADWGSLARLEREGVLQVESHTHDMHTRMRDRHGLTPRFLRVSQAELARDLLQSRATIAAQLGRESRYLAWPFGTGSAGVDSLAHALGFRRILTLLPKRNRRDFVADPGAGHPPDAVSRYAVTARTSMRIFRLMVGGAAAPPD